MFIIAGLGNPGMKYYGTRHNAGFSVVDVLCDTLGIPLDFEKHRAACGNGRIGTEKIMLAKPQTYMNLSGESIGALVRYYKADISRELLVISDDIDLPVGKLRLRASGSAGGHNGLKNIIEHLGTDNFMRLRIGVGAKPPEWELVDFVTGHFNPEDQQIMNKAYALAADAVKCVVTDGLEKAMNLYNRSAAAPV
ncbi:MAG: aminoacyl-tRNA hydrolase [Lachnospiraceae bacterium]|nr:aminoacyl-tRNA hydrolase [Lachnospiraceae bacterium]